MRVILFDGPRGIDRLARIQAAMVKARKVNRFEFAHMLNMGRQNSADYLYTLHQIMRTIHIVEWETPARGGHPLPVYAWGAGEDAPRPAALTRTEQYHRAFANDPAKLEAVRADARERQRKKRTAELKLRRADAAKQKAATKAMESNLERLRTATKRAHRGPFAALFGLAA